jgi:hypothetical protein
VSDRVVHAAHRPVLVVAPPDDGPDLSASEADEAEPGAT